MLLALLAAVAWTALGRAYGTTEHDSLKRLFAGQPVLEGRLTGDVQGRPANRAATAGGLLSGPFSGKVDTLRGSSRIERRAAAEPSLTNLHDLALLRLAQGLHDEAILTLESVLAGSPDAAGPASDLAAAYLTRAEARNRPFDLVLASGAALRALAADPHHPQALFNRALALTRLHLRHRAAEAWETFLRSDPSPGWRAEARLRLDELAQPTLDEEWRREQWQLQDATAVQDLVARFPNPVRLRAEEKLLPEWAGLRERGDLALAAERLGLLRRIGATLHRIAGDAMVRDAVAAIDRVEAEGDRTRLASLVAGHGAYGRGLSLYRDQELDRALPALKQAVRELRAAGSPFGGSAELYAAICMHYADSPRAAREFASLRRRTDARLYPVLAGLTEWMLGTVENNQGRPERALRHFRAMQELLAPALGPPGVASLHVLRAETFQRLGETEEAWRERLAALEQTAQIGDPRRIHGALYEPAHSLVEQGAPDLALPFLEELLANNLAWGNVGALTEAHLLRGRALDLLGRTSEALDSFRTAGANSPAIGAGPLRDRVAAALALAEGEALIATDPARAVDHLTATLESHLNQGFLFQITRVLTARARAWRALGDDGRAEADIQQAIAEHERVRDGVRDERLRLSYFEQAQESFDEMIALQLDHRRNGEAAFDYAERARSRLLLDLALKTPGEVLLPQALDGEAIRARLPKGVALVEYAVLPDRLVAWVTVASGGPLAPDEIRISSADLDRRVRALRTAVERRAGEKELRKLTGDLYGILVRPFLARLPADATLVFVPDRSLAQVPFAALFDFERRRYLVEDRVIIVAPSATLYIVAAERRTRFPQGGPWRALAVGDPAFDRERHPLLPRLPEAAAEAAEVAALHRGSELLEGEAATRDALFAAVRRYRLFHFAGHAVLDPSLPGHSRLVLAPGANAERDTLYASDLADLHLDNTEVVVLSACRTAAAGIPAGREVLTGLTAAFLAAGPPIVVASLWDVEDHATRELMRAFHRALPHTNDPAASLRIAQLQLLRNPDPALRSPAFWAGFAAFGGSVPSTSQSRRN